MSKPMGTQAAILASAIAAVGICLTAGATDALATSPYGCSAGKINAWDAHATCNGVSGFVRVKFTCHDGISDINYNVYGPWVVVPNNYSYASCSAPQRQYIVAGTVGYDRNPNT